MWPLARPVIDAASALTACATGASRTPDPSPTLETRVLAEVANVQAASNAYGIAADTNTLHLLTSSNFGLSTVSREEMVWLYDVRMVKSKPGRAIYDAISNTPTNGTCPLCGVGGVRTLDHQLPKTVFPALSVAPLNLVPACRDCNTEKSNAVPASAADEFIHPYFDDVTSTPWLLASVVHGAPPVVLFEVSVPSGSVLADRIGTHFESLKLGAMYARQMSNEFPLLSSRLKDLHTSGGEGAVRNHLEGEAAAVVGPLRNTWRGAAYFALAKSEWFIKGGYDY